MITTLLIILPFIAGIAAFTMQGNLAKRMALMASIAELCVAAAAVVLFNPLGGMQFVADMPWISSLGISFHVGIDGIGLLMVLLTAVLMPLIVLSAAKKDYPGRFYGLMLLMQAALMGVFTALDGFLFYVFWELALIPIWFICLLWGGENRVPVTLKFFIYTLAGSLFMLIGLIYLYLQTPAPHSFDIQALYKVSLSSAAQGWVFWSFFLAFAIKMPLFPFHTWQPDTYTTAPPQGTMLLSGIMLKMGIYGVIRWLLPVAPQAATDWMPFVIGLAVIGTVYTSVIALMQKDLKRLVAYSSIAHVGVIAAGMFSLTFQGLQGAVIQMLAHGINVVALFYIIDIIQSKSHTRDIEELGGIASQDARFSVLTFVVVLGSIALPLTNGFVGEFLLFYGLSQYSLVWTAVAGLSIILGAAYMLRFYQKTMLGESNFNTLGRQYVGSSELAVLVPAVILVLALGIYPKPLLDVSAPAVQSILQVIQAR